VTVRLSGEKAAGGGVKEEIRANESENDTRTTPFPGDYLCQTTSLPDLKIPVAYNFGLKCTQVEPQVRSWEQKAPFLYSTGTPTRRVMPGLTGHPWLFHIS
jgi:hypothetical protein